ncbi:MAG: exodeoxyribonuclease VII large subunit [Desulfatirhabdiaceae bacterium]|nr:exodeoxyribonuclease VII large subunit [Desulfatirhabdiaceae bacterium]
MTEQRHIYSVSEINDQIKGLLEKSFPLIWITGEISNFRRPSSGHGYFTLKDANSQIAAVMFRAQMRNLKFDPEDGLSIVGLGRISVYEPRGTYQVILEYIEPKGIGALQIAYEQLKAKLTAEGLFEESRKKPLPFLPSRISVITSPAGAVIHDIIHVVTRRFPGIFIEIVPVKVQGVSSVDDIEKAFLLLNDRNTSDVIILARGGGSLEDLQPFNSERVARAIFNSRIPVVSAVGHETDFTIADFVADFRAPTPSAAAEMVSPSRSDLVRRCSELTLRITSRTYRYIEQLQSRLSENTRLLIHPRQRIQDSRMRLDEISGRIARAAKSQLQHHREKLTWRTDTLLSANPRNITQKAYVRLDQYSHNNLNYIKLILSNNTAGFRELAARLQALSPLAILSRGYSITRSVPDAAVIRNTNAVSVGQDLEILLARGVLLCTVKRILFDGKTDI